MAESYTADETRKWISITGRCNNNCLFCLDSDRPDKAHKPYDAVADEIKSNAGKFQRLVISGGEPTIHPDIVKFVKLAKDCRYQKVQIITNGRMLSYRTFLRDMVHAGLDEITFSIHGRDANQHDLLTNSYGSFEQINKAVMNAREYPGLIINADICLTGIVQEDIFEIVKFVHDCLKIDEINIMYMLPQGNAWKNKERIICNPEISIPYIRQVIKYCEANHVVLWLSRFPARYLEGYERYIQDEKKLSDDIVGMKDVLFATSDPYCIGSEKCRYCPVNLVCKDIIELKNRQDDFIEIIDERTFKLQNNISSDDYLTPAGLRKKINEDIMSGKIQGLLDVPYCFVEPKYFGIIHNSKIDRKTALDGAGMIDPSKTADAVCNELKLKSVLCDRCVMNEKCRGMYQRYIKNFGFRSLAPIIKGDD